MAFPIPHSIIPGIINQTQQVIIPLHLDALLTVALDGSKWLEPGFYRVLIGQQHLSTIELQGKPMQWSKLPTSID